jgi:hypothetical protein
MVEKVLGFKKWQRVNQGKKFRDFFADTLQQKIQQDRKHNILGRELKTGEFGEAGAKFFEKIMSYGVSPDDICVDYGCGTLRLGFHAMNYLKPGRYWGFEIAEFLLDEGRGLVGDRLLEEKKPNLRVISPETVDEVAGLGPQMLFSVRVLKSVHPDELDEYFGNITKIIGTAGRAVIHGHWSDNETFKYGKRKWGHGMPRIKELLARDGFRLAIRSEAESIEGDRPLKHGMFCVMHETASLPLLHEGKDDDVFTESDDEAD